MPRCLADSHLLRAPCVARRAFPAQSTHITEAPKVFIGTPVQLLMSDSMLIREFSQTICVRLLDNLKLWKEPSSLHENCANVISPDTISASVAGL
jgi:hypothetical protein